MQKQFYVHRKQNKTQVFVKNYIFLYISMGKRLFILILKIS